MDPGRETEMNSICDLRAEQGSTPPVPVFEVACEKCGRQIELTERKIQEVCPHCGYHLRPRNNSMLSHFFFVLRHRMFTWRGRCTRKEFWSFELFSHILFFLLILLLVQIFTSQVPECSCPVGYLGAYIFAGLFALLVYIPFIGIPQIFLIARRLHDIGLSGHTVIIHTVLMVLMYCFILIACVFQSNIASEMYAVDEVAAQSYSYSDIETGNEVNDSLAKQEMNPIVYSLLLLASLMNFALYGLRLFFFVISFIDSNRGANQYGPSRKYPLSIT